MIYINIDRTVKESLTKQIYKHIKEAILFGTIQPGEKLPSTRELSRDINVARNMVIESYEQLIAEGYAYSKNGSGTYVSQGANFQRAEMGHVQKQKDDKEQQSMKVCSFRTGIPDLSEIPIKKWAQMYHNIALDVTAAQLDYQDSFGDYGLRTQISMYLNRARGACTNPENILITNGAAQSFSLLCKLVPPDGYALVENPLSYGILHTLESNHVKIKSIRLDEQGMVTSELPEHRPALIFTTPSHQFPTGVILPVQRRIELIRYAQKHNAYIVEDDYDSEYRFDGNPIQSMQYLNSERVIYVGTFSKTLMPALRIGYMVLPSAICGQMKEAKFVADYHSPILEQLTLSQFIKSGSFEQHIRKMRKLYFRKRNHLIHCLSSTFGNRVKICGAEAGLHFVAAFEDVQFDSQLMRKILNKGVQIDPMNKHYLSGECFTPYDNALIFGYGNTKMEDMEKGVKILSELL